MLQRPGCKVRSQAAARHKPAEHYGQDPATCEPCLRFGESFTGYETSCPGELRDPRTQGRSREVKAQVSKPNSEACARETEARVQPSSHGQCCGEKGRPILVRKREEEDRSSKSRRAVQQRDMRKHG